jgi:hypothetical protein
MTPDADHFKGKTVPAHLKEAREKGAKVSEQIHGVELSGSLHAGCDAVKETTIYLSILFLLAPKPKPIIMTKMLRTLQRDNLWTSDRKPTSSLQIQCTVVWASRSRGFTRVRLLPS